ncbi:MAG: threonine dehydratase [Candidatus Poriferisodalaceae bacterium]|jgi:threonine dehydratase
MSRPAIVSADVDAAHKGIADQIVRTPTTHSRTLSAITGAEVWLKFENHQYTASFKDRGSLWRLMQLDEKQRQAGVLAVSAGNHAQGVAYHATRLGIPATIVMPRFTPNVKVANTMALGAEVVLEGEDFPSALAHALEIQEVKGLTFVAPYDDPAVIAGQGTVAIELLEDGPEFDAVLVPVGGGGLIAGMATSIAARAPGTEVIGVQADRWTGATDDFHGDIPSSLGGQTIAEGIAVAQPGALTMPIIKALVDDMLLVSEGRIEEAVALLIEIEKTVCEGAGAAGLAALLEHPDRFQGRTVALVLSGGNIDSLLLSNVLQRSLIRTGRLSRLIISLRDVPGELARVSMIVGNAGANVVEVIHQRMWSGLDAKGAVLEVAIETRDRDHADSVVKQLSNAGYEVGRNT